MSATDLVKALPGSAAQYWDRHTVRAKAERILTGLKQNSTLRSFVFFCSGTIPGDRCCMALDEALVTVGRPAEMATVSVGPAEATLAHDKRMGTDAAAAAKREAAAAAKRETEAAAKRETSAAAEIGGSQKPAPSMPRSTPWGPYR